MLPRWKKVIGDLISYKGRTALVVMAIAVGVFSFGSVFITSDVLLKDMRTQYVNSNPAAITLRVREGSEQTVKFLSQQEGVTGATARGVFQAKLTTNGSSRNVQLTVIRNADNITIGKITVDKGAWPPPNGGIVLERSSAKLLSQTLGEGIPLEMPDAEKKSLVYSGVIHDVSAIPAAFFPQLTAYISPATAEKLGFPDTYNELQVTTEESYSNSLPELELFADSLKERLESRGYTVPSVSSNLPTEHWGKNNSQAFVVILMVIGVFSLLLSGFLVTNTIASVLSQQKKQIGIMKAIGASAREISNLYIVTVAFYGTLALIIALPLGLLLAYVNLKFIADFINIDIVNFRLPPRVFVMQLLASLLVPIIGAAIPIIAGVKVTVREAIAPSSSAHKSGRLDTVISNLTFLSRSVSMSLRNTFRKKVRLSLTTGTLVVAGVLFISVINVRSSLLKSLDDIMQMYNYSAEVSLSKAFNESSLIKEVTKNPDVISAEGQAARSVQRVKEDGSLGTNVFITGIHPDTEYVSSALLSQGRWLKEEDSKVLVIASELARNDPQFRLNNTVNLKFGDKEEDWTIVGVLQLGGEGNEVAYAPLEALAASLGTRGQVSRLLVRVREGAVQETVSQKVEDDLKDSGYPVTSVITMDTIRESNVSIFNFLIAFLMSMAVLVGIVGGLGLAGTMSLNVLERTREIGIMRSIGASSLKLQQIVLTEGIVTGLLSFFIAVPLSVPVSYAFAMAIGLAFANEPLPFTFQPFAVLLWLVISLGIALVASVVPAIRASRIPIRDTLAYE